MLHYYIGGRMRSRFQFSLSKLGRFKWTIHNCIGHPVMEILYLIGLEEMAKKAHDFTIPKK